MGNSGDNGWARGNCGLLEQEIPWKGHCGVTLSGNRLLYPLASGSPPWLLTIALRSGLRMTLTASLGTVGWGAMRGGEAAQRKHTEDEREAHFYPPPRYQ